MSQNQQEKINKSLKPFIENLRSHKKKTRHMSIVSKSFNKKAKSKKTDWSFIQRVNNMKKREIISETRNNLMYTRWKNKIGSVKTDKYENMIKEFTALPQVTLQEKINYYFAVNQKGASFDLSRSFSPDEQFCQLKKDDNWKSIASIILKQEPKTFKKSMALINDYQKQISLTKQTIYKKKTKNKRSDTLSSFKSIRLGSLPVSGSLSIHKDSTMEIHKPSLMSMPDGIYEKELSDDSVSGHGTLKNLAPISPDSEAALNISRDKNYFKEQEEIKIGVDAIEEEDETVSMCSKPSLKSIENTSSQHRVNSAIEEETKKTKPKKGIRYRKAIKNRDSEKFRLRSKLHLHNSQSNKQASGAINRSQSLKKETTFKRKAQKNKFSSISLLQNTIQVPNNDLLMSSTNMSISSPLQKRSIHNSPRASILKKENRENIHKFQAKIKTLVSESQNRNFKIRNRSIEYKTPGLDPLLKIKKAQGRTNSLGKIGLLTLETGRSFKSKNPYVECEDLRKKIFGPPPEINKTLLARRDCDHFRNLLDMISLPEIEFRKLINEGQKPKIIPSKETKQSIKQHKIRALQLSKDLRSKKSPELIYSPITQERRVKLNTNLRVSITMDEFL
ncbi:unnamed protein product [Moneuplotes crassus]|uniref:Uncharacterized protein n=1 Tax=Euplotes crassus TaxID=5936 RepID=A0AAD2DC49_EUPCR|nr:unnamed protein product [Moneuplotes crassus]